MKCMMAGVVAAVLAAGSVGQAWAQEGNAGGGERPRRPAMAGMMQDLTFEKMDANNDGKVTLEEFKAYRPQHAPGDRGRTEKPAATPPAAPAGQ